MENNKKTNGFAIAGFICSFLTPLLGLIFSIIGYNKNKECNEGKGLSIAGIIISSIKIVLAVVFIIFLIIFGLSYLITELGNRNYDDIQDYSLYPNYNDSTVKVVGNIFEIVEEKDGIKIDFDTNFKDVKTNLNGYEFSINCEKYTNLQEYGKELEDYVCEDVSISYKDKVLFNYHNNDFEEDGAEIILTDDYIIFNSSNGYRFGNIFIYNKNGELLESINNVVDWNIFSKKRYQVRLVDNKLYYCTSFGDGVVTLYYYDFVENEKVPVENMYTINRGFMFE